MANFRVVDQRNIQSRGRACVKFPVSCLIRDLLIESGILKPNKELKVLDLTYGEGRFWGAIPEAKVWGFDILKLNWVINPYVFFNESCEKWKNEVKVLNNCFDLVVVDPPFMPHNRSPKMRKYYEDRGNLPLILKEGKEASEYFKAPLLVHFMWKCVPYGFHVLSEAWFQAFTRYLNKPKPTWFGVLRGD